MPKVLSCLAIATLALAACGSGSEGGSNAASQGTTPAPVITSAAPSPDAAKIAAKQAIHDECEQEMGDFLDKLGELDSRLSVGLAFADYGNDVGDARVAYDQIDFKQLNQECIQGVGIAAENAFNDYVAAYNTWNHCIGNLGCSIDTIKPQLRAKWGKATHEIAKAKRGLDRLAP
jgi:hypothetical protein